MTRTPRKTNAERHYINAAKRARGLALLHHRQAELRDARRSIPLQDALVADAYFELKESAAYAAYLESLERYGDVLRGVQAPAIEATASITVRTKESHDHGPV